MDKLKVEQILFAAGFNHAESSGFGHIYRLDFGNGYFAVAFASLEGSSFFGPAADSNKIDRVGCHLESGGTTYRFYSENALTMHLSATVTKLRRVSENPDLLRCPICGVRNVHMKEPRPGGKQFKPFLSCEGMHIEGKGRNKGVVCDGTSKKLPALITYT